MSWEKVKLGDILTESKIISEYPNPDRRITVRLKVLGVQKRGLENEVEGATKQYIRKAGQFIYGKQNFHKGAFGIVPQELDEYESSSDLPAFDIEKSCLPEFLFYYFKQGNFYLELAKIASGVATQRINTTQLFELEIALPGIPVQRQLILNIQILENKGSKLSKELIHQLSLVKKLRQQFLQDAVQGKLVEQNPKDEPASELLKRIKAEKLKLISEKKLKINKELLPIKKEEIPFEIPEGWVWCKLGEIISFGPSNGFSPKESKLGIGIKCLTLTATTSGIFKEQFYKLVDEQISQNSYLWLESGDILIQRGNSIDYVGIAALYEGESHNFIFPDLMIKIRFPELINTKFIHQVLISPPTRKYYADKAFGAQKSMPKINQPVVLNTLIPLPPLSEQHRIVEKLEELMQNCDELEGSIKQSVSQNEKLLQQVLREALRKEVVKEEAEKVALG